MQSFTIAKAQQAITFVGAIPSGVTFGDTGVTVSATSATVLPPSGTAAGPSGIPVVLTSKTATVCTIAGNAITTVAAGTCTIAANQAGNTNYEAAPEVTRTFEIARGKLYVTSSVSPTRLSTGTTVPRGRNHHDRRDIHRASGVQCDTFCNNAVRGSGGACERGELHDHVEPHVDAVALLRRSAHGRDAHGE
jgi:hypothetical protein